MTFELHMSHETFVYEDHSEKDFLDIGIHVV